MKWRPLLTLSRFIKNPIDRLNIEDLRDDVLLPLLIGAAVVCLVIGVLGSLGVLT